MISQFRIITFAIINIPYVCVSLDERIVYKKETSQILNPVIPYLKLDKAEKIRNIKNY